MKKFTEKNYNTLLKVDELPIGGAWLEAGSSLMRKTGDWKTLKPVLDLEKCIHCGQCWAYCPDSCIKFVASEEKTTKMENTGYDYDHCKGCGICSEVCPKQAITMEKAR